MGTFSRTIFRGVMVPVNIVKIFPPRNVLCSRYIYNYIQSNATEKLFDGTPYCLLQKCLLRWWLSNLSDKSSLDNYVLGHFVTMSVYIGGGEGERECAGARYWTLQQYVTGR